MEFFDDLFKLSGVTNVTAPQLVGIHQAVTTLLGADLQHVLAPIKVEIRQLARGMRGDQQRATLQLLAQRQARQGTTMEQQLVIAALAELQDSDGPGES